MRPDAGRRSSRGASLLDYDYEADYADLESKWPGSPARSSRRGESRQRDIFVPSSPYDAAGGRRSRNGRAASRTGHSSNPLSSPLIARISGAAISVVLGALLISGHLYGESIHTTQEAAEAERIAAEEAARIHDVNWTDRTIASFDAIPSAPDSVESFSLIPEQEGVDRLVPQLSDEQRQQLDDAMSAIESRDSLGFVMIDLQTGAGIAHNVDENIFGASSFKGPLAVYLVQEAAQGSVPSNATANRISDMITWSDNKSFLTLRYANKTQAFNQWLSNNGMDYTKTADSFPTYSVRESAKLWLNAFEFLEFSGTDGAEWLANQFAATETSFLRDGVHQSSPDALTWQKAGWSADSDGPYDGVVDAGVINDGGHWYLISVMSGLSDSDDAEALVTQLCATLYSMHGALSDGVRSEPIKAAADLHRIPESDTQQESVDNGGDNDGENQQER